MSMLTTKMHFTVFLSALLLFTSACRSSRSEEPTATPEASETIVEVVTATPTPSETGANSNTDTNLNTNNVVETTAIPPTSTPVVMASSITLGSADADDNVNDSSGEGDNPIEETDSVAASSAVASANNDQVVQAFSSASNENARDGLMPFRIQIPSISLDTPVVELSWHEAQADDGQIFSEWDVADQAAGWHKNSSLIGENGNVVLSGHNNILGAVFRELDQLKRGDEAVLSTKQGDHRYLIDKVMIVPEKYATREQREANAAWIGHFEDDRLTLVSCWPRDDNSHRIIVVAYAEDQALP